MSQPTDLKPSQAGSRKRFSGAFAALCMLVSSLAIVVLIALLVSIFIKGGNFLSLDFLTGKHLKKTLKAAGSAKPLSVRRY